jgi:hypothetical protein
MKPKFALILALIFLLVSACAPSTNIPPNDPNDDPNTNGSGQIDESDQITQSLTGQNLLLTWREGEAVYGTYFFVEVHFCSENDFILYGRSERNTVLDNLQVNTWQSAGTWDIVRLQGQIGIQYQMTTGESSFTPIALRSDGTISAQGVSITPQGQAQC